MLKNIMMFLLFLLSLLSLKTFIYKNMAFLYFDIFALLYCVYHFIVMIKKRPVLRIRKLVKILVFLSCIVAIVISISYIKNGSFDYRFLGRILLSLLGIYALSSVLSSLIKSDADLLKFNNYIIFILLLLVINNVRETPFTEDIYILSIKSTLSILPMFLFVRLSLCRKMAIFEILLLCVMTYLAILNSSRSFFIGLFTFFITYRFSRGKQAVLLILAIFFIIWISPAQVLDFFVYKHMEGSNSARWYMMTSVFKNLTGFMDILFGMGLERWRELLIIASTTIGSISMELAEKANPHNFFLELFIRGGVLLVLFVGYPVVRIMLNSRIAPMLLAGLMGAVFSTGTGYERYILILLLAYGIITKKTAQESPAVTKKRGYVSSMPWGK